MVRGEECKRGISKLKFKDLTDFGAKLELWYKENDIKCTQF